MFSDQDEGVKESNLKLGVSPKPKSPTRVGRVTYPMRHSLLNIKRSLSPPMKSPSSSIFNLTKDESSTTQGG